MSYLIVVFLNAFVDIGHKILIQDIFYQTATPKVYTIMSALINAMILLPFVLFFTPSGYLSDKFSKTKVMRWTALAAIPLTVFITLFYYAGCFWLAFTMTFLLSVQATINSPAKYGYIKELFGKEKLAEANAYVQTIAIISILAGTVVFTIFFQVLISHYDAAALATKTEIMKIIAPTGFILILMSGLEYFLTLFLSVKPAADPHSTFKFKPYIRGDYIRANMNSIYTNKVIFGCIIALGFFWGINQVILANYGAYLKIYIHNASAMFAQGSLALGGLGILLGALVAGKSSKHFIESGIIPVATLGMTIGLFFMPIINNKTLVLLVFLMYGFFGGMLIVPLNALIQFNSPNPKLGKILAANNFVQNVFMIVLLVITAATALMNFNPVVCFNFLFLIGIVATIYAVISLPQSMVRYLTYSVLSKIYTISASGIDNIPSDGGVLLLGNHVSYIDWAIIQITCPRAVRFVMEREYYNQWHIKWILKIFNTIPISSAGSKNSIQTINDALKKGDVVALFPEGFVSRNGQLGKFHRGFERAIENTGAIIVPLYIRGLWGSMGSLSTNYYRKISKHIKRNITVCYGKQLPADTKASALKSKIFDLGTQAWIDHANTLSSIPAEWLYRAQQQGDQIIAIDGNKKMTGYQMVIGFIRMRQLLQSMITKHEKHVGVMMPPSIMGILSNFAALALNKVVVNINYTASKEAISHSIDITDIKTVITSRIFLERLEKRGLNIAAITKQCKIIYLEDYKDKLLASTNWIYYLAAAIIPNFILKHIYIDRINPDNTAVIYFTSGSEGLPKGAELSHRNILINAKQTSSIMNIRQTDSVLSCLPLFHAFGLTGTTLMPLIEGIPLIFHPDPTDAAGVAKAIALNEITVLCSTSTFLSLYIRHSRVEAIMFRTLRLVVSGAEKLSATIEKQFYDKFGLHVLEGYGTTETAPVVSINLPDILIPKYYHVQQGYKPGAVGLPVPGTSIHIVNPKTLEQLPPGESGLILVAGPQLMKGYFHQPEQTKEIIIHKNNTRWYKTGDQGFLDEDGYLTITDRYSRFAKIAGEMVSLSHVENAIAPLLPENIDCAAVALPDEKKGEKIVLLVTKLNETPAEFKKRCVEAKIKALLIPNEIQIVDEIPKLGTGKTNFAQAKKIAQNL